MCLNAAEAHRMLAAVQRHPELVTQIVPSPYGLRGHDVMKELLDAGFIGHTTLGTGLPAGPVSRHAFDAVVRFEGKLMVAEVSRERLAGFMARANQDRPMPLADRNGDFLYAAVLGEPAAETVRIATTDWNATNQAEYFGAKDLAFREIEGLRLKTVAAKALLVVAFVHVPKLLSDVVVLRAYGLDVTPALGGMLWSQALLTALVVLPVAALASVTTAIAQMLLAAFVLVLAVAAWSLWGGEFAADFAGALVVTRHEHQK